MTILKELGLFEKGRHDGFYRLPWHDVPSNETSGLDSRL